MLEQVMACIDTRAHEKMETVSNVIAMCVYACVCVCVYVCVSVCVTKLLLTREKIVGVKRSSEILDLTFAFGRVVCSIRVESQDGLGRGCLESQTSC